MKKKKYIGQIIAVKFSDRKTPLCGLVVDYNDDWTLMKYNPTDYMIDGYVIFKNKNVESFSRDTKEKFKEKIMTLKGVKLLKKDLMPLTNLSVIFQYLNKKFGVFLFETKSETACYVGHMIALDDKKLRIDFLNANGKWDGKMTFRPNDIRVIQFDSDYINSLKLVALSKRP